MTLPTVVLVGRQNVGKSTLFNRLCETRRALMSDIPGTTRDWQEGRAFWNGREFRVIDTGGYAPGDEDVLTAVRAQVERWVKEADATLWLVDGSEGLTPSDQTLAGWMRAHAKNVILLANKMDDAKREENLAEFHRLGFKTFPISSSHGRNIYRVLEELEETLKFPEPGAEAQDLVRVALVGRPNVGKSSTLNAVLGEERMIVSPIPGTTRDAVDTLLEKDGTKFLFIDTAGLRSKKSVGSQGLEGLTRIMSEKALDRCEVAVLLLDAGEGIREGDIAVGRLIEGKMKACVVAVNKWDLVADRPKTSQYYRDNYARDLPFMSHAPIVFYSAKTGHHLEDVLQAAAKAFAAYHKTYDDEDLTAFFWREVQERPYSHRARKLVFRTAQQSGTAPTTIALRCNMSDADIHFSYQRHLENVFRKRYALAGAPLIFKFKKGNR